MQYKQSKEQLLKEQQKAKERENIRKEKLAAHDSKRKYIMGGAVLFIIVLVAVGVNAFIKSKAPGPWDNFAKCLTDEGAVMYGEMTQCVYTQHQAGMFGKSFKYINYEDFSRNPEVSITPTWYINGEKLEGEQPFEVLAAKTGCTY